LEKTALAYLPSGAMKKKNSLFCFTTDAELEKASFLIFAKPFHNVCVCLHRLKSYSEILDQSEK
jgi:hypothetical protein